MRARRQVQVDADPVRRPDGEQRVDGLQKESGAVLDGAAIAVRPLIRAVVQELVEQVAVRAMNFDPVESRAQRVGGAGPEARSFR
jgi:hypothetical protein